MTIQSVTESEAWGNGARPEWLESSGRLIAEIRAEDACRLDRRCMGTLQKASDRLTPPSNSGRLRV